MVATILAGLGADDQTLCAAILHDTVEDTPFTMTALRRGFGGTVATVVAEVVELDRLGTRRRITVAEALALIGSADRRVATVKLADRLHNMQTVEFLPLLKQVRKARESLDVFAPAAEELRMPTVGSELQSLAFSTLIRALIHSVDSPLVDRIVPRFTQLLTGYNAGAGPQHQLRVRMVVHAGEVHYDGHGCFGVALDTAFRLLEAPAGKRALARAKGPLVLIVSDDAGDGPGRGRVSVDVGGDRRRGWISLP
jgi:GTP pyrophosphokinase